MTIKQGLCETCDLVRWQAEKEDEIKQIADQIWKDLNIRLMSGMGTSQKPYHIVILDNSFDEDELITARFGKVEQCMNNTYKIQKIAEKLVENGIQNFTLYGVAKYTNYGIKED